MTKHGVLHSGFKQYLVLNSRFPTSKITDKGMYMFCIFRVGLNSNNIYYTMYFIACMDYTTPCIVHLKFSQYLTINCIFLDLGEVLHCRANLGLWHAKHVLQPWVISLASLKTFKFISIFSFWVTLAVFRGYTWLCAWEAMWYWGSNPGLHIQRCTQCDELCLLPKILLFFFP